MTILGAIFAGGAARRFGTDKAAASIAGRPMIEHVADRLRGQCDELVVVGRAWPGLRSVADRPRHGLGPLGALAGALAHAAAAGHDLVVTAGCDLPDLPRDLVTLLPPAPAVIRGQPLLGLWEAATAGALARWLEDGHDRAMRGWIGHVGARAVTPAHDPANINTVAELAAYLGRLAD